MSALASAPWIAIAAPALLAVLVALIGERGARITRWIAVAGPALAASVGVAYLVAEGDGGHWSAQTSWLAVGGRAVTIGYSVDGLVAIMLVVVGVVAAMVMVFSVGYMEGERGLARYYAVLSLFTMSMVGLVMADGFAGLFIAWELVGACSYLLIGFWFTKPSAANAAMKAFLVTRVGDVGLLVAIAIIWARVGDLAYDTVFASIGALGGLLGAVCVLLFIGAAGKSAQFPLHIWLPDAMEGPTPVSALIHAATMVAAGVFLIARTWPLFEQSPASLDLVLWIGTITAVGAAFAALAQRDIKKVLAYSTISQLGYMFAALGAGAWVAAIFHLVTHAAFKALLFLGSGSIIHATHTQDLHEMGGLAKKMPITAATWVIGAAALAGVPGLAGFFSKDEVLHAVLVDTPVAGWLLAAAALLTAFYVTRTTVLAFAGEERGDGHAHESGWTMALPLIVLAIPAAFLGWFGHSIAEVMHEAGEALDPTTAIISGTIAVAGIAAGWAAYRKGPAADGTFSERLGIAWRVSQKAFGFDGFVTAAVVLPARKFALWLYRVIDRKVVDGFVEWLAVASDRMGGGLTALQSGDMQGYAALMGAGLVFLLAAVLDLPESARMPVFLGLVVFALVAFWLERYTRAGE